MRPSGGQPSQCLLRIMRPNPPFPLLVVKISSPSRARPTLGRRSGRGGLLRRFTDQLWGRLLRLELRSYDVGHTGLRRRCLLSQDEPRRHRARNDNTGKSYQQDGSQGVSALAGDEFVGYLDAVVGLPGNAVYPTAGSKVPGQSPVFARSALSGFARSAPRPDHPFDDELPPTMRTLPQTSPLVGPDLNEPVAKRTLRVNHVSSRTEFHTRDTSPGRVRQATIVSPKKPRLSSPTEKILDERFRGHDFFAFCGKRHATGLTSKA